MAQCEPTAFQTPSVEDVLHFGVTYLWYCDCKKLNSSLILSIDSTILSLNGAWPGCGTCKFQSSETQHHKQRRFNKDSCLAKWQNIAFTTRPWKIQTMIERKKPIQTAIKHSWLIDEATIVIQMINVSVLLSCSAAPALLRLIWGVFDRLAAWCQWPGLPVIVYFRWA